VYVDIFSYKVAKFTCVSVYVYICSHRVCKCRYICLHMCKLNLNVLMYVSTYIHTETTCVWVYVYMHVHQVYSCVYAEFTCMCVYLHTCTRVRIHTEFSCVIFSMFTYVGHHPVEV